MMKHLTYILFFFIVFHPSFSQISPPPKLSINWERIFIKDVGSFDLPPTMEVQKGKYKEFADEIKRIRGFDTSQITAQPKGLNDFNKTAIERYARIILETTIGSPGDYDNLNFNVSKYSQEEIKEIDKLYKQQIQQSFTKKNVKITEWYPLKIEKVNGMFCVHISYKRQLLDNPIVLVDNYNFHNNDRMHSFTLSYKFSESEYWKSDFETVLSSFRISNVR